MINHVFALKRTALEHYTTKFGWKYIRILDKHVSKKTTEDGVTTYEYDLVISGYDENGVNEQIAVVSLAEFLEEHTLGIYETI